jgi:hypothetical protein
VKFDLPGVKPQRYRLVYELVDQKLIRIKAVGERAQMAVYLEMVDRIASGSEYVEHDGEEDDQDKKVQ